MKLKSIYKIYLHKLKPIKYMKKVGVNFLDGKVHIYGNVAWGSEPWIITLGENVYITDGVKFITHDGGTLLYRKQIPDLEITKPITVGDNVFIGTRSIIMPGVHIGNNVIIAAGSVVSKDLPDNGVYGGVPAKFIKPMDEYFEKIQQESLHLGHLKGKEKDRELRKVLLKQE